eukprot:6184346-Pleurochrysis_carterae.AAC.4
MMCADDPERAGAELRSVALQSERHLPLVEAGQGRGLQSDASRESSATASPAVAWRSSASAASFPARGSSTVIRHGTVQNCCSPLETSRT